MAQVCGLVKVFKARWMDFIRRREISVNNFLFFMDLLKNQRGGNLLFGKGNLNFGRILGGFGGRKGGFFRPA